MNKSLHDRPDVANTLQSEGVVLLRQWCPAAALAPLLALASTLEYPPFSHSIAVADLPDELIQAPLRESAAEVLPGNARWLQAHSWVRRRYAPALAPKLYAPNSWHQDGALKLTLPDSPTGQMPPLQPLLTLWVPLHDCLGNSPALEFIRSVQHRVHHWAQLSDGFLREQFPADRFWTPPVLYQGDALLFLPGTLHRTHASAEMTQDRFSVEYRFATGTGQGLEPAVLGEVATPLQTPEQ